MALGACQTGGTTASYSVFFTPLQHLNDLTEAGKLDEAAAVYERELAYFSDPSQERLAAVNRLGSRLAENLEPQLIEAATALEQIEWPAPPELWPQVAEELGNAESLLSRVASLQVLERTGQRPAALQRLKKRHAGLRRAIDENVADRLADYDLAGGVNFFGIYPAPLEAAAVLHSHEALFLRRIAPLDPAQLNRVHDLYGKDLSATARSALSRRFHDAVRREAAAGSGSPLEGMLRTATLLKGTTIPFDAAEDTGDTVALSLLGERPHDDFAVSVTSDLPLTLQRVEAGALAESVPAADASLLLLIEPVSGTARRSIESDERVDSQYVAEIVIEPNPAYAEAEVEVTKAMLHLQQVRLNAASSRSTGNVWGDLIVGIAGAAIRSAVEGKLDEATARMNAIPPTLERPVYADYTFRRSRIRAEKQVRVRLHVLDRTSDSYTTSEVVQSVAGTFTVLYGLHPDDRNHRAHVLEADSEDDVAAFEAVEVTLPLSRLIDAHLRDSRKHGPAIRLAALAERVAAGAAGDGLARRGPETATVDPRNVSITVLRTGSGTAGTGFYVREDLILTNAHVVAGHRFVEMRTFAGAETFGKVVAEDRRLDLALIKVEARGEPVRFYAAGTLPTGVDVEAIGHPKGLEFTITRGVASAVRKLKSRYHPAAEPVRFIQTDTALNPGNSGGPLFLGDKVIGVNSWKPVDVDIEGIGFAVHYGEVLEFLRRQGAVAE